MSNLSQVTGDLPQLGEDIGGFLGALSGPLAVWILLFVIVGGIASIFTAMFLLVKSYASGKGKK